MTPKDATELGYIAVFYPSVNVVAHPSGDGFAVTFNDALGARYDITCTTIDQMMFGPQEISRWPTEYAARQAIATERQQCAEIMA